ncbi:hypothetical protein V5O48_016459 [Marasmius crinis-equi]|uniref:Uncharacterized protein n=1 Tax=Marasmius crinis-equi TaxID=585013 RepID=A0ABR3ERN7_9AGAR
MSRATTKITSDMGEIGKGLTEASQIDMSIPSTITNVWAHVQKEKPWYFEMKLLLAERPNITPVGIGNSSTTLDVEADINSGKTNEEGEGEASAGNAGSGSESSDDEEDTESQIDKPVQKAAPTTLAAKKTPAQPAKSQPAAKPEKKAPKKTKFQEFAELELAEEKSREKELENQRLQTLQRREQVTWEGKVELAREERKAAERKMKHEARMKQMEQQHEFRMQMLRSQAGMTSAWAMPPMSGTDSLGVTPGSVQSAYLTPEPSNGRAAGSQSGYNTPGSLTSMVDHTDGSENFTFDATSSPLRLSSPSSSLSLPSSQWDGIGPS